MSLYSVPGHLAGCTCEDSKLISVAGTVVAGDAAAADADACAGATLDGVSRLRPCKALVFLLQSA